MAFMAVFLLSFSCSPETDINSLENLEAVNASANNGQKVERPWKIRSAGTFEFDPSAGEFCEGLLPLKILGSGEASHIGRYTVEITWCTGGPGNQGNDFITGTITAANGHTINFESKDGSFTGTSVEYKVTNGTGRFHDAKGEFKLFETEPTVFESIDPPSGTYANAGGGYIVY